MVCSLYCGWDHIAMVCENWMFWLILDLIGNNILSTLIYIHTQLFTSINAMVWVSTFLGCKVWVVNCKLYIFFSMEGSCYIIMKGDSSMLAISASDQWCISDEYKTSSNQSCHNIFLLVIVYDLSNDGFFFPKLGSTCIDEFY
jgi:hypothetical protein